jgi:hypothetical protein
VGSKEVALAGLGENGIWHCLRYQESRKGQANMTKTLDVITEAIRSTKHPFRRVEVIPDKPHKNRYERRKIKEYIRLGDWAANES